MSKEHIRGDKRDMNITFLIGNGFDLGLGLKTRYTDFYHKYCRNYLGDNSNITSFRMSLSRWKTKRGTEVIDWSDFESAFGLHAAEIDNKKEYIERFEHFVSQFNEYLEKEETRVSYDNVSGISQMMHNAVTTYFHVRPADREEILRRYNQDASERRYNFISFNYTKCLDNCVSIFGESLKSNSNRKIGELVHVHGYVEENMIVGVNDVSQIANPDFASDREIISEIVKPIENEEARTNYSRQAKSIIDKSAIICIYGMSLGETDSLWWNYIAEWLLKDKKNALVILKYEEGYNKRFPFSQLKHVNHLVDRFLSFVNLSEEARETVRNRIYIGINHNVFELDLCKKSGQSTHLGNAGVTINYSSTTKR